MATAVNASKLKECVPAWLLPALLVLGPQRFDSVARFVADRADLRAQVFA
jgi:hypothetical protein